MPLEVEDRKTVECKDVIARGGGFAMNRRDFCLSAAALAAVSGSRLLAEPAKAGAASAPLITADEIARIDRQRILLAADKYLGEPPITITAYSSSRSNGGKHDYFSEGDYWWPDPKNPNGPYIRRDGFSNPRELQ